MKITKKLNTKTWTWGTHTLVQTDLEEQPRRVTFTLRLDKKD